MRIDITSGRELIRQIEPHVKGGLELIRQIESHVRDLVDAVAAAHFWHSAGLERAEIESTESEANARAKRDRERREATDRRTQTVTQAGEEREQQIAAIKARYEQLLGEARAKRNNEVNAAVQQHRKTIADAGAQRQDGLAKAEASYKRESANAEEWYRPRIEDSKVQSKEAWEEAEERYQEDWDGIQDELQALMAEARYSALPFEDSAWEDFEPSSETLAPRATRLGTWTYSGEWGDLEVPALAPIIGGKNLVIKAHDAGRAAGIQLAQGVMLRLLASLPPGKLRLTLIDPMGRGQNVAAFMHLVDPEQEQEQDQELVAGKKAWANPQHIELRLADLNEHVENVIQRYLRNQYATIDEYNEKAGELAEPYRVVVALNFPAGFSETAARQLLSLAESGPRCGVYVLMTLDTKQRVPHGFDPADFEKDELSTVVTWHEPAYFKCLDLNKKSCELCLDELPDPRRLNQIIEAIGEAAKSVSKVEVPFERIAPTPDERGKKSQDGLRVPLGPAGARGRQYLDLGKSTAQHVLLAGRTGSGKSTLLHTLITSLALAYGPEEVELYLIDFKRGVEFKPYAEHQLPHARVIAIAGEREFGLSVLKRLDDELKWRGDLFRESGVDNLANYRQETGKPLPRILLLVDEFQEFFVEDDAVATQTAQILDRMVRQGRYSGIHILLSSQTLAGSYSLARSTVDQIGVRIALQCSEADSRLILAEDNPAARQLTRPGEAIYNAANGRFEGNRRFQVALLPDEVRQDYLEGLRGPGTEEEWRARTTVFEGLDLARVEDDRGLKSALGAAAIASGYPGAKRHLSAWLGDPVAIREEPVAATFRRQSGSNLLIVGQGDEAVPGMVATAITGLTAQVPPSSPEDASVDELCSINILDFGAVDSSQEAGVLSFSQLTEELNERLPGSAKFGRRRQLEEILGGLTTELQHRLETEDEGDAPTVPARPLFLFVHGLHRARDLRPDDTVGFFSSFDEEPAAPKPAEQFATLLRDGPEAGIHTIVWCDSVNNLNRSLDRRSWREFAMRVALQMSAEDSSMLLESPVADKLGSYRALFYDEEEGLLEKFRPYRSPSPEWLAEVAGMMVRA